MVFTEEDKAFIKNLYLHLIVAQFSVAAKFFSGISSAFHITKFQ